MAAKKGIQAFTEDDTIDFSHRMAILQDLVQKISGDHPINRSAIDFRFGVKRPITSDKVKPGDIDICAIVDDNFAISIEVKKFKFVHENGEDRCITVGYEQLILKAIEQANETLKFGFNRTGIVFMLNYDGSARSSPEGTIWGAMNLGVSDWFKSQVTAKIGTLREDCFVAIQELAQVDGNSIEMRGAISSAARLFQEGKTNPLGNDLADKLKRIQKGSKYKQPLVKTGS